jgi:hypothetical protein
MSQTEKSAYFQALRDAGVDFPKHYREYSTAELKEAHEKLVAAGAAQPLEPPLPKREDVYIAPAAPPPDPEAAAFFGFQVPPPAPAQPTAPVAAMDPNEMAGQRQNTKDLDEPIRTDEQGRVWLQEEVRKPAYPKPRARRVLRYMDPGSKEVTVKSGDYTETFEVSGDMANARPAEIKITLPSYQVGIYRDPRFPFKVVTYNSEDGFDLDDVRTFYGGSELVPADVKLKYVQNVLCYDIRTTVRAIEAEYRSRVLGQHG